MPFGRVVADRKRHSSRLSSPNFGSDLCPVFKTRALKYDCRLQNPDRLSEEVHLWRPHRATKVRRDASANVASGLGVGSIAIGDSKAGASSDRKSRLWGTDARPRIGDRCRGESISGGRQSTGGVPRHSSRARRPPPLPNPPSEPGIAPFHSDCSIFEPLDRLTSIGREHRHHDSSARTSMPTEKGETCVVGSAGMRLYSESRNPRYLRD